MDLMNLNLSLKILHHPQFLSERIWKIYVRIQFYCN